MPVIGPPVPDMAYYLDAYPRCRSLLETFRKNPSTANKTPLAVLNEYAMRQEWEVGGGPHSLDSLTV